MNLCHDCNSSYEKPGTCNCFAPGGKRHVAPALGDWMPMPAAPMIAPQPWYPNPSGPFWSVRVTAMDHGEFWLT